MSNDEVRTVENASVTRTRVSSDVNYTFVLCAEQVGGEKCGRTVDVVENDDGLAEKIVKKSVKDRAKGTYECPNGHNGKLEIAE